MYYFLTVLFLFQKDKSLQTKAYKEMLWGQKTIKPLIKRLRLEIYLLLTTRWRTHDSCLAHPHESVWSVDCVCTQKLARHGSVQEHVVKKQVYLQPYTSVVF